MRRSTATTVTQAEIARQLGIHQTTVSAILSGKRAEKFMPEMRERVVLAAERLGYRPSAPARALRGSKSGLIGVFHFGREKDVEFQRLREIVTAIHRDGYKPLAMPMDAKIMWLQEDEVSACSVMLDSRVEGLVLSGFADDFDLTQLDRFRAAGIPMVSVSGIKLPDIPLFAADRHQAIFEATSHLIREGRRRLVYLHRWSSALTGIASATAFAPVDGFRRAAAEHGLSEEEAVPFIKPPPATSGLSAYAAAESAMQEVLASGLRPDGVVCYDDSWAIGVYGFCQRNGISIPDDIAVVGFENQVLGAHLHPRLTSMAQPLAEIAGSAVEALTASLAKTAALPNRTHFFPCELVVRESSRTRVDADSPIPIFAADLP